MVICIFLILATVFVLGFYFGNSWGKFSVNEDKTKTKDETKSTK